MKKLLKEKCDFSPVEYEKPGYRKGVLDKALKLAKHHAGQQMAQKF